MKVTNEMVDHAVRMLANFAYPTGKRAVRNALEAALADIPEPGEPERDAQFYDELERDLQELEAEDPKIKALGDKVRDAEQKLLAVARAAVERAVQHADKIAKAEGWEVGGGLWSDEASDHLYDEREALGAETYALAKELLAEAERERKDRLTPPRGTKR